MSHFLARLVERARGTAPLVEPIIAPRFAPTLPVETAAKTTEAALATTPENPAAAEANPAAPTLVRQKADAAVPAAERANSPFELVRETLLVSQKSREPVSSGDVRRNRSATGEKDPKPIALVSPDSQRRFAPKPGNERRPASSQQFDFSPNESATEAPIVRVTIGRIDVRATPPAAEAKRKAAPPAAPKLSLDAYLKERKDGAR